jgi:hypothetical protein
MACPRSSSCFWDALLGEICFPAACDHGAIAHYDGTVWSTTLLDTPEFVRGMFGTAAPDQARQLWLWRSDHIASTIDYHLLKPALELVPVLDDGHVGAPIFTRSVNGLPAKGTAAPQCERISGSAVSPSAAWFSDGCFVYRWNGTELARMPTAVEGIPPGDTNGVWAESAENAWVVGTSVPYQGPDLPDTGFAAYRRRASSVVAP